MQSAEAGAEFTAAGVEINANHDYRIADIDAVIAGLNAFYNGFHSNATAIAKNYAQSMRGDRVDDVNDDRTSALNQNTSTRDDRVDEIADDKADAILAANSNRTDRRDMAAYDYDQSIASVGSGWNSLPTVDAYDRVGIGMTATPTRITGEAFTLVSRSMSSMTHGSQEYAYGMGYPGSSAPAVTAVADGMFARTGYHSATDMASLAFNGFVSVHSNLLRTLPYGDELVEFADIGWSQFRQQSAANAAAVNEWAAWAADGTVDFFNYASNESGLPLYFYGELYSRYIENGAGIISSVFVNPTGTVEGLVQATGSHYDAGGALGVVGIFTGTVGLYESWTGEDFLSGGTLTGDERFDRGWMGVSGLMTSVGTSGVLRNLAQKPFAARGLHSAGNLFSDAEILHAFRDAKHTATSRALLDGIEDGSIAVSFKANLKTAGLSRNYRISVNNTMNMDDILTTLVHEGRHHFDKLSKTIPMNNPGGLVVVKAELRAWIDAGRFAHANRKKGTPID